MNKKMAHLILSLGDIFCIWGLWIGCHEFQRILSEVFSGADMVRYGNRVSFLILGSLLPPVHLLTIIEHFWPDLIHKYKRFWNQSIIIALVALVSAGMIGTSWIKSQVENAGYVYCHEMSGVSSIFRSLVYTKDMAICEDLVAAKYKHRN